MILLKDCCYFCSVWGSLASEMLHWVLHGSLNVLLRIRVCTHVTVLVTSKGIEERLCGTTLSCHTHPVSTTRVPREPSRRKGNICVILCMKSRGHGIFFQHQNIFFLISLPKCPQWSFLRFIERREIAFHFHATKKQQMTENCICSSVICPH